MGNDMLMVVSIIKNLKICNLAFYRLSAIQEAFLLLKH